MNVPTTKDVLNEYAPLPIDVAIGLEARDLVTGLTGIVIAEVFPLHGMRRWSISPPGDGKTYPDPYDFDAAQVEVVGWGMWHKVKSNAQADFPDFKHGTLVKDKHSPFIGTIITITRTINGCLVYTVQAPALNKDGKLIVEYFNGENLEVRKPPKAADTTEPARPRTGGPSARTPSACR